MTKQKKAIRKTIPKSFGGKLDLIVKLLHTHLNKKNKRLLFDTFKALQETQSLSMEYIRYLILNSQNAKMKRKTYSNKVAKHTTKIMQKFGNLLRRNGVKIELQPTTYTVWKNDIDLIKVKEQGVIKRFKI